jgi:hypothetical protein
MRLLEASIDRSQINPLSKNVDLDSRNNDKFANKLKFCNEET